MFYHVPALLDESIRGLNIRPDGIYVDVTFGGGGHSMEILKRLRKGLLIAFDQDEDALQNVPDDRRLIFLNQNFRFLKNNLKPLIEAAGYRQAAWAAREWVQCKYPVLRQEMPE